ncbi:hypothetical protein GCM10008171_04090 [Methylopila jiangsuensis]|uniref:Uncharacterized protein n=1 Tax=Methylopila jiangsuensis TaxID=586230 RepID=A0A9W6JFY7_9HYPH|nr:hypothetical protein [Methylopila jiangsuensis]MDR6285397.1 hypothetical protein [Methylopila jiangsuensis]GLK75155.1 hypothetical protein GCM10008171_04090 [Methylopila jiangsuensis]
MKLTLGDIRRIRAEMDGPMDLWSNDTREIMAQAHDMIVFEDRLLDALAGHPPPRSIRELRKLLASIGNEGTPS